MDWNYISGFFDADGSLYLVSLGKNRKETLELTFCNCEKDILKSIKKFIESELNLKGAWRIKKPKKETHSINYELKYTQNAALVIANNLDIKHPKKAYRVKIYNKIQECTPRNGKYSDKLLKKRNQLVKKFYSR